MTLSWWNKPPWQKKIQKSHFLASGANLVNFELGEVCFGYTYKHHCCIFLHHIAQGSIGPRILVPRQLCQNMGHSNAWFNTNFVISLKHSPEWYIDASFLYVYLHSYDLAKHYGLTDKQTDRQTNGQTDHWMDSRDKTEQKKWSIPSNSRLNLSIHSPGTC